MSPVVHYYEGADGQWYVRIVSQNGQIMLDSEGYTRKWSAKRAANRVARLFGLRVREAVRR